MGHHHDEAEEEQVPFQLKGASGAESRRGDCGQAAVAG